MGSNISITTVVILIISIVALVSVLMLVNRGQETAYLARDYSPIGSCTDFGNMKPADYDYWLYGFFKTQSENIRGRTISTTSFDYEQAVQFCAEYVSCTAFSELLNSDFKRNPISRCCIDLFAEELGGSQGVFGSADFEDLQEMTEGSECPF